jgi:hypothetical protein
MRSTLNAGAGVRRAPLHPDLLQGAAGYRFWGDRGFARMNADNGVTVIKGIKADKSRTNNGDKNRMKDKGC